MFCSGIQRTIPKNTWPARLTVSVQRPASVTYFIGPVKLGTIGTTLAVMRGLQSSSQKCQEIALQILRLEFKPSVRVFLFE